MTRGVLRDYQCPECGHEDELFDNEDKACSECPATLQVINTGAALVKGNFEGRAYHKSFSGKQKLPSMDFRDPGAMNHYKSKGHIK